MEETYSTKAIILKRVPFRENDIKVSLYSPDRGRLDLVARGAKKIKSKLAGHIEPISLARVMIIRGKRLDYLGGAINEVSYFNIKNDLTKLEIVGGAINIFNRLIKPAETDKELFNYLISFLDFVDELKNVKHQLWSDFFIFKLLVKLGYKPELYSCLGCSKKITPQENYFDLNRGGLICKNCILSDRLNILTISDNTIKVLRLIIKDDFARLSSLKIDSRLGVEIKKIVSLFYQFHLE